VYKYSVLLPKANMWITPTKAYLSDPDKAILTIQSSLVMINN